MTVEGLWEGLKVFQDEGIDITRMTIINYKGLRRHLPNYKGHSAGVAPNSRLLPLVEARKKILLPSYKFVLDKYCGSALDSITKALKEGKKVVILDKHAPADIFNESKPVCFALLLKKYLLGKYPH